MKRTYAITALGIFGISALNAQNITQQQAPYKGIIGTTLADSKEAWTRNTVAAQGAPNVVWIVLDDVGFGTSSAFGGLIPTQTFDSLANTGLRYTNFHTTAICAPTRAAVLTGRNHHRVHEGGFSHVWGSFGFPGWDGRIPSDKGTIAEILRESGYNTFAVGKYGLTPDEDITDAGPFDRWPSGKGFDHFFGFLGSQDDQYKTTLIEDNAHIKPDGRHLNEQITDKAIQYVDRQQASKTKKPFFLYYAPGATHAPHQVPDEWRDIYKGKFDHGWDAYREQVFKKQKELGIIPKSAVLPDRNPNIPAWNKLSADEKKLYARFFEVYAAYLTYTDHEIGRLLNHLKGSNLLDNTAVFVVIGDNGASKEGSDDGDIDQSIIAVSGGKDRLAYNLAHIDLIGKPEGVEVNYPLGWAQAANAPFRFWKSDAHSEGGTRNPLIISYPKVKSKGQIRTQYGHVIDLLPTTLELAGITPPEQIRGVKQDTIQGTSLVYSFDDAAAPSRHHVQYYYLFGSRAIYKDGWKASYAFQTKNKVAFVNTYSVEDTSHNDWKLYHVDEDFTERVDLSKKNPEKLQELKALFEQEARKNNVYPLIDWDDVIDKGKRLLQQQQLIHK
ncbi:arylsulfatase [bacterium A37T11]|nr:arylsulfatase [bacterium A37T11]